MGSAAGLAGATPGSPLFRLWKDLAADPKRYRMKKDRSAEVVLEALELDHLGMRDRVEVVDVSTPLTWERYTGNWMGAMQAKKPNS